MDEMLSIGEFSARSGLSPKMLRSYAGRGVLVPAAVDRSNGYRYYSVAQLDQARLVALLRRARIPVAQIAAFLKDPSLDAIDRWERSLEEDARARRDALSSVREALDSIPARNIGPAGKPDDREGAQMLHVTWGSATDVGRTRPTNQDAISAANHLFAVADGMGSHGRGEAASRLAVDTLSARFVEELTSSNLADGIRAANRAVWEGSEADEALKGMGTTLTAAAVVADDDWTTLAVANVGDSRAYLSRDGDLTRVTRDHSLVEELVAAGDLTEERARTHPQRSILTRAIGLGPDVDPDVFVIAPSPGDRMLLCTDGLFNELGEDEIAAVLRERADPREAAGCLVELANAEGGRDNVSVVVIDLV